MDQHHRERMVQDRKQAVRRYSFSAMLGMEGSDGFAVCIYPHVAAGNAGSDAWGATLDYRWIMTDRQLSL